MKKRIVLLCAIILAILTLPLVCKSFWNRYRLGPAGQAVMEIYRNYEKGDLTMVAAHLANPADAQFMVRRLKSTPVTWKNLRVISEEKIGNVWKVKISADVTDLPQAFAAVLVYLETRNQVGIPGLGSEGMKRASELGIDSLRHIEQSWTVAELDNTFVVDLCNGTDLCQPDSNLLNYMMAAFPVVSPLPMGLSQEELRKSGADAYSVMAAKLDLDFSQVLPIYREGIRIRDTIAKSINAKNGH